VSLNTAPVTYIVPWGVYSPSVVTGLISGLNGVDGPQTATSAVVNVFVDVANMDTQSTSFQVASQVLDNQGNVVGSAQSSGNLDALTGFSRIQNQISLTNVNLWNTGSPYLYSVVSTLTTGTGLQDQVNVTIGIRSAYFDPVRGFILNGIPTKIRGLSMHSDFGGTGSAVPDRVNEYRVYLLKHELGGNGWRTAHNPVASELLDYCDKYGMLVWEENRNLERQVIGSERRIDPDRRRVSVPMKQRVDVSLTDIYTPEGVLLKKGWKSTTSAAAAIQDAPLPNPMYLADAQAFVLRDRNHPSIFIWSLCNEGGCFQGSPQGGIVASAFKTAIFAVDTMRPITGNSEDSDGDTLTKVLDVEAFSYNYGDYLNFHLKTPWKTLIGGESASCTSDRFYYGPTNQTTGFVNADDSGCVVGAWQPAVENTFLVGNFAWTGHDYKGEPTPTNWPSINSHFGIIDICGFNKDSVGYYRSWWRNDPTSIHIEPSNWNSPVPVGSSLTAVVYSSGSSVELLVNGVSQGKKSVPYLGMVEFPNTIFTPGSISAISYDVSGAVLATETVSTTGTTASIRLSVDFPADGFLVADGADVALVRVSAFDSNGIFVPDANFYVNFTVTGGTVYGVCNGNPNDHDSDKATFRSLFNGLARVIVQSTTTPGAITVTATPSNGVAPNSITITSM
jgi:beta-galactosidase